MILGDDSVSRNDSVSFEAQAQGLSLCDVYSAYVRGTHQQPRSKMVEKMMAGGLSFSWCAFLVGPLYLLYRKQYALGWSYLIICLIANCMTSSISTGENILSMADLIWTLISLALDIVIGFAFYPLYSHSARKAYENCRASCGKDWEILQNIERAGGTSWVQPAVAAAIALAVSAILVM